MNAARRSSWSRKKRGLFLSGPVLTLAVILAQIIMWSLLKRPQDDSVPLLVAVAYSTLTGGVRQGVISAVMAFVYSAVVLAEPDLSFTYDRTELARLLLLVIGFPTLIYMLQLFRLQLDRARNDRDREAFFARACG